MEVGMQCAKVEVRPTTVGNLISEAINVHLKCNGDWLRTPSEPWPCSGTAGVCGSRVLTETTPTGWLPWTTGPIEDLHRSELFIHIYRSLRFMFKTACSSRARGRWWRSSNRLSELYKRIHMTARTSASENVVFELYVDLSQWLMRLLLSKGRKKLLRRGRISYAARDALKL